MKFEDLDLLELGNTMNMSGMVLSNGSETIIVPTPEGTIHKDIKVLELDHEEWKKLLRQTDIQEVEVLIDDGNGIKKAILRKTARQIEANVIWKVYKRDGYKCRYCAREGVPLTVDHLVLWENGGPSIEENLATACRKCNKTRGNMPYEEWIRCKAYGDVSYAIPQEMKQANIDVLLILDSIPIMIHKPNRGGNKR